MTTRNRSRTVLTLAAVAMMVILTAASAGAAITFDGFMSWLGSGNPYTGTFDASGSDKLVVVATGEHNFPNNLSGDIVNITYDGVSLTKAVEVNPADPATGGHGQTATDIWYLDNPGAVHTSGAIVFSVVGNGNNYVYTAMGLSGAAPGVGPAAPAPGASSVNLTTTVADSMVIFNIGMGGQGNTASPLPGVTATSPAGAVTIDGLEAGNNWAGHAVAYAPISSPGLYTFSFDTTKTDVATIAAAFEDAYVDPNLPTVDAGVDMITLSRMDVVLAPTVVNNDTEVPQRDLSYTWTTDAPDGYTVQWNPSNTVEAPTVTITPDTTGNPSTVTLTLKVDLVGTSSSASDTMEIDVYDDACLAAQIVSSPSEPFDPSDFDKNCITDLRDYAVLAAKWLVDYALTAPITKP